MFGPYPAGAKAKRTDQAGRDPSFERYLREEFLGGTTRQELESADRGAGTRLRAAVVRFVKEVLYDRRRAKPVPTV